ncbi:MAG TPA: pantetheine-phosphate adenylyltransferase [Candidatus Cloacimonas sp.]|nr:pantetheine-phosphate adenylyltransferase [Candidatus Cloacimonadota bacterium]HCX73305.1 pantetheine-phosphate adenylyltransferase [Candidatus Cloacimonas sp.]
MKRIAVYPGTFDPITNGHIDILRKAFDMFDEIIIGVAKVTGKKTLFNVSERAELCRKATEDMPKVKVQEFDGLVVEFAKKIGAVAMVRGLRAISDFEYELSQALMNKKLSNKLDTVFFVPDYKYLYLSSTMIRQVVSLGADVKDLIPDCVEKALIEKFSEEEK